MHYPFENAEWFEHHFPADFIVEYIGQTRGWFYTLHVLATAIFDRPAFETCISHGIVLGSDGKKMSKSLRNYPDVREVFDRDGADAMRWFLMSSPILRGGNLIVTEQGIRDARPPGADPAVEQLVLLPALRQRGRKAGYDAQRSTDVDATRWTATCWPSAGSTSSRRPQQMDDYEVADACDTTRAFLDVLTNWYIRRSRDRFWGRRRRRGHAAFDTLYTVLETVCRVTAPLLPLTTEEVWRGLTGERSVHLTDWPSADELPADDELVAAMDQVRDVCSATSALRKAGSLRNRLPLSTLTVVVAGADAAGGLRGDRRRRAQREGGPAARRRPARGGVVRRLAAAHRQRPRRRPAARQGRADRDQGLEVRRLVGRRGRQVTAGGLVLRGGRVHPRDRRRRRRRLRRPGCCPAAASWCSTPRSRPSSRPRAWPATWSGPCSRPAATPASTSPTGSR